MHYGCCPTLVDYNSAQSQVITFGCSGVCFMLVAVVVPGKVTGRSGYRKMNGRYREAHLSKVLSPACAHPPFDSFVGSSTQPITMQNFLYIYFMEILHDETTVFGLH